MNAGEPSLQTHLQELRAGAGLEAEAGVGLSTVIFCGKMRSENESEQVMQMHREVVEEEVNSEGSNLTGLLMGQASSVLHLLEGPSHAVLRALKRLADHEHFRARSSGGEAAVQQGRVVYTVEARPRRFFPEWYSCVLPEKKASSEELNGDSGKDVVHDLAQGLLGMGTRLAAAAAEKANSGGGGGVEMSAYADVLPGKNVVLALNNCKAFFSLDEYVSMYAEPMHLDLESEAAFPLRRIVNY